MIENPDLLLAWVLTAATMAIITGTVIVGCIAAAKLQARR